MIALPAINTIASNALFGTIATKLIDSMISSKISQKQDRKKWLREKRLSVFSSLNDEISSITCENLIEKKQTIKSIISQLVLLIEDKKLINTLHNYVYILEEYDCFKNEINMNQINDELITNIRINVKNL